MVSRLLFKLGISSINQIRSDIIYIKIKQNIYLSPNLPQPDYETLGTFITAEAAYSGGQVTGDRGNVPFDKGQVTVDI